MNGANLLRPARRPLGLPWLLTLMLPLYAYVASCWLIRPLSHGDITLSAALPCVFVVSVLFLRTPRKLLVEKLLHLRIEFSLLAFMAFLSLVSVMNSSEPFRAFRIAFPCILPFLLFFQLMAIRSLSPAAVASIPRTLVVAGLLFSGVPLLLSSFSGAIHDVVFPHSHRFTGFFENPNQHSIMLCALIPVAIGEFVVGRKRLGKIFWGMATLLLVYCVMRTGSKTGLLVTGTVGWLFYILINIRDYSPSKRMLLLVTMSSLAIGVVLFGMPVMELVDPTTARKVDMILSNGVGNYYSMVSRLLLWEEAYAQGSRHWLIGSGAGEKVLGFAHSHNLVLTYFQGLGLFGAIAISLLCGRILLRGVSKGAVVLFGRGGTVEKRRWACYVSACVYVLCNQLSDSFGPSTIAMLWLLYLPAVLSEDSSRSPGYARKRIWSRQAPATADGGSGRMAGESTSART